MNGLYCKRVLVTGGHGFLGTHVVNALKAYGEGCCEVIVPKHEQLDLTSDFSNVRDMINYFAPDTVIHLAAVCGGIGANQASPGRFFYKNLIMGLNLMHACTLEGIEKFVQVGTVCSYPKFCPIPFKEEDIWNGYPEETNAPYGIAKKVLLVQAQAYRQQYGFNAIYLIPVNLYGPGDNFDAQTSHVIPAMIRKMVDAKIKGLPSITLWGTGKATREFLYVKDAAKGIVKATELYDKSEPVNLGNGISFSINELAQNVAKAVDYHGYIEWDASKPDGQPNRRLNVEKAYEEFNWLSKTCLEVGLKETVEWYLETSNSNKQLWGV